MRGEPFTPATLRVTHGPGIPEGAFLIAATMAYRVDEVCGRTLHCTRWPLGEVPADAERVGWAWDRR